MIRILFGLSQHATAYDNNLQVAVHHERLYTTNHYSSTTLYYTSLLCSTK